MRRVTLELQDLAGRWVDAGAVAEAEPPGSLSSTPPGQARQVFVFGWWEGGPGVWRSQAGVDVASPAIREVHTSGLERLADLESGPFQMEVWVKRRAAQVRFAVVES